MNDVTRQVAGALGTAVIGSIISSVYASRVADSVASLPEAGRAAAEDSIGRANAVAASLPASDAEHVTSAAAKAFIDALAVGFTAAAICALVGALAARRWLPARHRARPSAPPVTIEGRAILEGAVCRRAAQVQAREPSRICLSRRRSLRFARRTARAMNGAAIRLKPAGSPRLRSVMRVLPSSASDQV
jgi:hypothetical protein